MNLPAVFESHFELNLGSQIPDDCWFVLGLGLDVGPESHFFPFADGWPVFPELPEVMRSLCAIKRHFRSLDQISDDVYFVEKLGESKSFISN